MRLKINCIAMILLFCGSTPVAADDVFTAERKVMTGFLKTFANADTKGMLEYYAAEVTVMRGATLLDPKYGAIGTSKTRDRDVTLKKEKLAIAYERAIKKLGGKDDWRKRGMRLLKEEIRFIRVTRKHVEQLKSKGVKLAVGDTVAIVIPKGDSLTFILRKHKSGKWVIVAEHWD